MSESQIKVTDKRIFTADGELREEYRFLEDAESSKESSPTASGELEPVQDVPEPEPGPEAHPIPDGEDGPGILDLVGMLAEPVPYYLGETPLPDGSTRQDPRLARLHVDLLEVLRKKTEGNLTEEESSVLEDILYQLKMRCMQRLG